jgi:hypothetical protein
MQGFGLTFGEVVFSAPVVPRQRAFLDNDATRTVDLHVRHESTCQS